jgi:hypothetical protein
MTEAPTVAVYYYTQTGQLKEAVDAFLGPIAEAGWRIEWRRVRPVHEYPFPWPLRRFVGIFPDAVDPGSVVDVEVDGAETRPPDLVLLAFQVWYLAPSVPMRSVVIRSPEHFRGRTVVGLTACRNMWYSAALAMRRHVTDAGGSYAGTVAAVDSAPAATTFVTTMRWLLTGNREAFWSFPRAGVGPDQHDRLRSVGKEVAARVAGPDQTTEVAGALGAVDAAPVDPAIAAGDLLAGRVFRMWGALANAGRPGARRALVLMAFVGWLSGAVALGLPGMVLARAVARTRFDAAVRTALSPALAGPAHERRIEVTLP